MKKTIEYTFHIKEPLRLLETSLELIPIRKPEWEEALKDCWNK